MRLPSHLLLPARMTGAGLCWHSSSLGLMACPCAQGEEFLWSDTVKGTISSSFFIGYTLTNFVGKYDGSAPQCCRLGCAKSLLHAFGYLSVPCHGCMQQSNVRRRICTRHSALSTTMSNTLEMSMLTPTCRWLCCDTFQP
jgi:hypothetical protein